MNIQPNYYDNFIDATNEFMTGGSGNIGGGGGSINNYLYLTSNSNLYLDNPNTNGNIFFKVKESSNATIGNYNYSVKIDKNGKLFVYHLYTPLNPTMGAGWYDVENELANAFFNTLQTNIQFVAIEGQLTVIGGQISTIQGQITAINVSLVAITSRLNNSVEAIEHILFRDFESLEAINNLNRNIGSVQGYINNARTLYNAPLSSYNQIKVAVGEVAQAITDPRVVFGIGIIGGIYALTQQQASTNYNSNFTTNEIGFTLDNNTRRFINTSNHSNALIIASNLNNDLSNGNLSFGFINSNITTPQFVPSLKSNKIMLGNITTPNSSYQMEMTGDLNLNQLYINSTSLTSLLNQKQNNITAVSPLYLTTGNLGLNYDSSLTKIGNNLSVVKTATAPLNWTGNDIALSFDSTLLNNAGSLGVSIAAESKWSFSGANIYNKALTNVGIGTNSGFRSKLNVIGDIYCSSNINIGTSNLPDFNGSFFNVAVNGITTDDEKERYLLYLVDGSLTLNEPTAADIFMVGAGGYGGTGAGSGGGGAGEVIYYPNFPLPQATTMTIQVGYVDPNSSLRRSRIYIPSGNTIMTALGGGNGGTSNFYSTSGGTVSALTTIAGTNDAYISITATTTLTLNSSFTCDIFMIGGGGGGGRTHGGGGGAGAYYYGTNLTLNNGSYSITVGSGGSGGTNFSDNGTNGGNTSISLGGTNLYLVNGGGKGGGSDGTAGSGTTSRSGKNGGCGGGGGSYNSGSTPTNTSIPAGSASNTGTNGTGNNGGTGCANQSGGVLSGGGGGGIGGTGGNAPNSQTGNGGLGGDGIAINITGTNQAYGGGGGGGVWGDAYSTTGGLGGGANINGTYTRVGGQGGTTGPSNNQGLDAVANTGSGGGGGGPYDGSGGNGSAGIVIIRFKNYLSVINPSSGGSGGGGAKNQTGAAAGVKFDDYKSFSLAGLNGTSTTGGNGGSGNTIYNTRYTTNITGTPISVGLGGSGVGNSPAAPATKSNYGDGGDGNGGSGFKGIVIIRFKKASTNLHLRAIKDNANTGLILNANEVVSGTINPYQLRIFPWSDTYTTTGIPTRGWSFRCHDGAANLDLINLFSFFGGRVGIKTKNPGAVLDVNGDIQCKTFNITGNEQYGISCQITNQNAIGEAAFVMYAGQGTNYGGLSLYYLPTENLGYISCSKNLRIKTGNDAANSYIHIDNSTGNIGIGNNAPSYKLVVNGTIGANDIIVSGSINATTLGIGQVYATGIDNGYFNNLNGTITNNKFLFSSNIYINNFIDCQNKPIYNCSYLYGGSSWTNELFLYTNIYHKDDQGRERIYFKNDTTGSPANHFTLFKSGGTTHAFSDKDDVQYCLLERFGITAYYEVISGGGYDAVSVLDASSTGTYVYRKMYVKLNSFTEVHRCFCEDPLYTNYNDFINEFLGRIVISKGKIKTVLKQPDEPWKILEGKDGITIDDSHPMVELSRKINDKRVIGVITKRENSQDMENRLVINSLGETAVWIVNTSGNIQNGDLITTSNEIGYGQLQLDSNGEVDEIIRNFTLGKSMIDCDFQLDSNEYKCEIIDETRNLRRAFLPIFIYSG